jgi:hypothetical protein
MNTASKSSLLKFSLESLVAATVFAAISLWAWEGSVLAGVVHFAAFVGLVPCTLAIAIFGARLRQSILAGVLGGAILWSIFGICIGMLDAGVFWLQDSVIYGVVGVTTGSVCGVYAKLRRGAKAGNGNARHKGIILCSTLFVVFAAVFGLGRVLAWRKHLQPDFGSIVSYERDSDGAQVYEFWGNGLGDGALASDLPDIPKSRKVAIFFRCTRVTDEDIREFEDFSNLVSIDLSGTAVSEEGANWLREKLPNCEIRP